MYWNSALPRVPSCRVVLQMMERDPDHVFCHFRAVVQALFDKEDMGRTVFLRRQVSFDHSKQTRACRDTTPHTCRYTRERTLECVHVLAHKITSHTHTHIHTCRHVPSSCSGKWVAHLKLVDHTDGRPGEPGIAVDIDVDVGLVVSAVRVHLQPALPAMPSGLA